MYNLPKKYPFLLVKFHKERESWLKEWPVVSRYYNKSVNASCTLYMYFSSFLISSLKLLWRNWLTDFIQRLNRKAISRDHELLGKQASLNQRGRLRLELGLLLGPVGLGSQDPVEQLLRHWLATPLLRRDARRVHQRLPLVLLKWQFLHR
jgi:hypothetical protein